MSTAVLILLFWAQTKKVGSNCVWWVRRRGIRRHLVGGGGGGAVMSVTRS